MLLSTMLECNEAEAWVWNLELSTANNVCQQCVVLGYHSVARNPNQSKSAEIEFSGSENAWRWCGNNRQMSCSPKSLRIPNFPTILTHFWGACNTHTFTLCRWLFGDSDSINRWQKKGNCGGNALTTLRPCMRMDQCETCSQVNGNKCIRIDFMQPNGNGVFGRTSSGSAVFRLLLDFVENKRRQFSKDMGEKRRSNRRQFNVSWRRRLLGRAQRHGRTSLATIIIDTYQFPMANKKFRITWLGIHQYH